MHQALLLHTLNIPYYIELRTCQEIFFLSERESRKKFPSFTARLPGESTRTRKSKRNKQKIIDSLHHIGSNDGLPPSWIRTFSSGFYTHYCLCENMISIILLNWNSKRFLTGCIQSIRAQTYPHHELLIIDDQSTDGSAAFLQQHFPEYPLIQNTRKLGYCGGANLGIQHTNGEFVLLINADIILAPDFLARLLETIEREPHIGIATGKLLRFDRRTLDSTGQFLRRNLTPLERGYGEPDIGQYEQPEEIFSSCGGLVLYRRVMLDDLQIDGEVFDEAYFAYYEDLDIGWRAQVQGWRALYIPTAIAYHYRGGGLAASHPQATWIEQLPFVPNVSLFQKPPAIQQHVIKNRYLTLIKNASIRELWHGMPAILKFEFMLWGYILLARPQLITVVGDLLRLLPEALRKRKIIQAKRKVFECLSV